MKKTLFAAGFVAVTAAAFAPGFAAADTVTPFGDTTGTGPWNLTSVGFATYGGLDIALSSPITFSSLATVSVTFTDNSGGAGGGSPRLEISATNGDYFTVYLGTPPNFNDSNPATFTAGFSGINLNNATNNSTFELTNTYQTLASLQAIYGADQINDVQLQVDGGWSANGTQDLTVTALGINGTSYTTSAALPAPGPIAGAGIPGLMIGGGMLAWWRRKKTATAVTG